MDNHATLLEQFQSRRSVRQFSREPVNLDDVRECIAIAGTAPSGANCQPWTFALVTSASVKRNIRLAAEKVEDQFYNSEATEAWREDLSDLRTGTEKAFLEEAPCLIVLFLQKYGRGRNGRKINHYYPGESLGMATGFLISALHLNGFCTLPYTPAPMGFIKDILDRPDNERPYLILPVGYPAPGWTPPQLKRKALDQILVEY
ncbi:MAG: nitroreductase family protein [Spirochaetales bacterium]|nr:nitroreductase family protein [Spirochaetales bacterium]